MKAWLMTWEWTGPHAALEDRLAGILSPGLSEETVGRFVEFVHNTRTLAVSELAEYAKHPRDHLYRASWHNEMCHCGAHPFLAARRVEALTVVRDPDSGLETIRWVEPARYTFDAATFEISEARGPLPMEITRTITGPLSNRRIRS